MKCDCPVLALSDNQLSGGISPELGNLVNLKSLSVSGNRLGGEIPSELGDLVNLESLIFSDNRLGGEIPSQLGNLANLQTLYLDSNRLSGEIPLDLGNLASLQLLLLGGNQLSGDVPPDLGNLASLAWLDLSSNQLTGSLPLSLAQLTALKGFAFGDNIGLCASNDTAFQKWLTAIPNNRLPPGVSPLGPNCGAADANDSDTDDDALVEVVNLSEPNAVRWGLGGDGVPTSNTASTPATYDPAVWHFSILSQ